MGVTQNGCYRMIQDGFYTMHMLTLQPLLVLPGLGYAMHSLELLRGLHGIKLLQVISRRLLL